MPFAVEVLDETSHRKLDSRRATDLCTAVLSHLSIETEPVGEVSVALVDTEEIQNLNLKFREIDAPTDVLSFEVDGLYGEMAGEVVISPADADPEMGVEELVVHGMLHLCGLDHGEDFEASEMARVQREVMERVGGPDG